MKKVLSLWLFASVLAMNAAPAYADRVVGDFTLSPGSGGTESISVPSLGSVSFTLNRDGTIAADLQLVAGRITGFGFNSSVPLPESGFGPAEPDNTGGWGSSWGVFQGGFLCSACIARATWTIGSPGDYTSVWQVLDGTAPHAFFLVVNNAEYAADAIRAVPEPAAYATLLAGLAVLGLLARRRRPSDHTTRAMILSGTACARRNTAAS